MPATSSLHPAPNPAVDLYIAKAAPFAQLILHHIREVMHSAVPGVEEQIKWSMPFFVYGNVILGNMAAFKAHCSFGIWGEEITAEMRAAGLVEGGSMGSFGRLTSVADLPKNSILVKYLRKSAAAIDAGVRTKSYSRPPKAAKPEVEIPPELLAALKANKPALKTFDTFPASARKEYIDWVADAKREATRTQRVAQAVAWMAEGKRRNWKYENC